jgi:hypothetical protein
MNPRLCSRTLPISTRRDFLTRSAFGLGGLGLASMMQELGMAAEAPLSPLAPKKPHFPARAKRVIHIFCEGGPSQVDTFDPKPALEKYHGKMADEVMKDYQKAAGDVAAGSSAGSCSAPPSSSRSTASAAWRSASCFRSSPHMRTSCA